MHLILLLFVLAAAAAAWYLLSGTPRTRRISPRVDLVRAIGTRRTPASDTEPVAPLTRELFQSLMEDDRRTWWSRELHIGGHYAAVCTPRKAATLDSFRDLVTSDLNDAAEDTADGRKIILDESIQIVDIVEIGERGDTTARLLPVGHPDLDKLRGENVETTREHSTAKFTTSPRGGNAAYTPTRGVFDDAPENLVALFGTLTGLRDSAGAIVPIPVGGSDIKLGRDPALGRGQIDVETVSWEHCLIRHRDGQFVLIDLASHNGTYVNGQRITEQGLRHGDVISLGTKVKLRLTFGRSAYAPTGTEG